uniref:J domain-containing protein n=1 Tax=Macrostomum lignano TaxID=282301 RepID=A0A1I8JR46_9PLAT
ICRKARAGAGAAATFTAGQLVHGPNLPERRPLLRHFNQGLLGRLVLDQLPSDLPADPPLPFAYSKGAAANRAEAAEPAPAVFIEPWPTPAPTGRRAFAVWASPRPRWLLVTRKKQSGCCAKACRLDAVDGCPEAKRLLEQLLSNSGSHGGQGGRQSNAQDDDGGARRRRTSSGSGHPERQFTEEQASGWRDPQGARAQEAFKAIGNAYSVLADPAKRQRYDMYGSEEEQQATRRHSNGRGYYYDDYSRGFEADVSPEEIFNMFFGGGFPTYEMRAAAARRHQRHDGGQAGEAAGRNVYSMLLQFAPIFLLMLMSVLSGLMHRDPWYSLSANNSHLSIPQRLLGRAAHSHSKVPYYVKPNFRSEFTGNLGQLEAEIEDDFFHTLRVKCYRERSYTAGRESGKLNSARSKSVSKAAAAAHSEPDFSLEACRRCLSEIGSDLAAFVAAPDGAADAGAAGRLSRSFSQLNWMMSSHGTKPTLRTVEQEMLDSGLVTSLVDLLLTLLRLRGAYDDLAVRVLLCLLNCTDRSLEFCLQFAKSQDKFFRSYFPDLLNAQDGGQMLELNTASLNDSELYRRLAEFPGMVDSAKPYLVSPVTRVSATALIFIAFALATVRLRSFWGAKKSINYLISILRLGLKAPERACDGYSVAEMSNINRLALNDANKDLLVELNVLSVVKLMLDSPEAQDVQEGLEILFTLSFSQRAAAERIKTEF